MSDPANDDSAPLLRVRGIGKRFPGVVALADLTMAIRAGEVHGLVGQNGAGKSTLINILSGIYQPDEGTVDIDGAPVVIADARAALALGIATVHQELSLFPNLTVAQNLALGREPRRWGLLDNAELHRRATAVLGRLGLNIAPDAPVSSISLAERQMVEIAKALATNPRLLILDEPTASLGQHESEQLFTAMAALKRDGVAVLYVSHRFAEVLALCDVATVLRNGRHVITTPLAGWSESRLTEAMLGARSERYVATAHTAGSSALSATGLRWGTRVNGTSLDVRKGEIVGITGLLGSGQNELGRMLGGDLRPDEGLISVAGRPLDAHGRHAAARAGICLLTEERKAEGILPNLSVRENIAIASLRQRRGPLGVVGQRVEAESTAAAARDLGVVAASPEMPMRTLSGGNQQKALLARWTLADADVFILIEPTRGVDVGARAEIYRRLDALAKAGKAIVVVSSDLAEVLAVCDRILVVRHGVIAAATIPAEVTEEQLNLLVQGGAAA